MEGQSPTGDNREFIGIAGEPCHPTNILWTNEPWKGRVLYTGPEGIRDHRVTVEPEHRYVGIGTMSGEGTSESDYLWRAAPGTNFPRPKTSQVGEIGWSIPEDQDWSYANTARQIMGVYFSSFIVCRWGYSFLRPSVRKICVKVFGYPLTLHHLVTSDKKRKIEIHIYTKLPGKVIFKILLGVDQFVLPYVYFLELLFIIGIGSSTVWSVLYPGPNEVIDPNSDAALVMNVYQRRSGDRRPQTTQSEAPKPGQRTKNYMSVHM